MNPRTLKETISDAFVPQEVSLMLDKYILVLPPMYINGWSFVHGLSGILIRLFITTNAWIALNIHTAWEIFQFFLESKANSMVVWTDIFMDTIFFIVGFYLLSYPF